MHKYDNASPTSGQKNKQNHREKSEQKSQGKGKVRNMAGENSNM